MVVIGQFKGHLTCHACVNRQIALRAFTAVGPFAKCTVVFIMKTYNQCPVSFSNFVIVLINWEQVLCPPVLSVIM